MFEIAFKVNPDSEFYKNYFMKKAEKEKFLELADEFVEKYFLGEWLSLAFSARLTIRLNAEGTRKYAPQTTKHSNRPGFSTFKKQSPMNRLWEDEVCKCVDWKKFSANDFWWMNFHGTGKISTELWDDEQGDLYGYFSSAFSGKNTKVPESVTQMKLSEYYAAYENYEETKNKADNP